MSKTMSQGAMAAMYRAVGITLNDNDVAALALDSSGNLLVNVQSGGTAGAQYTDAAVTIAHPVGTMPVFDNAGTISKVSAATGLPVNVVAGGSSGAATGSAVPANAFYEGGLAKTALPTAATDGNLTGVLTDKFGRQVVVSGTLRDLRAGQTTTISNSTSETTVVTAGSAGVFNDLVLLLFTNTSATGTRVDMRDATAGSVIFSVWVPANDVRGFSLPGQSIPQTTAANNWTAQCGTGVTDLRVYALFEKNK